MNGGMAKTVIRPLAIYSLLVDAKNHKMTSVSRSPRVEDRDAPKKVIMICVGAQWLWSQERLSLKST